MNNIPPRMGLTESAYAPTADIRRQIAQIVRPPVRTRVSEAARQYVRIGVGGNNSKPWDASTTPYMVEPMDCLNDRSYGTVCFVGPARTGKTQSLLDCWIGYAVKHDPGDMMILHTSQDAARDYSRRRVDRLFRHSPELSPLISTYGHADNTFDKTMTSGMILSIGWPTIRQLSSRDIKYMAITDYDRGPEDIDGEGDKYSLAQKRTETFLSSGKTLVESSPGNDWSNRKWEPQTLHELPPSPGIVVIYNRGDRRMYYWQCFSCQEWFIPAFKLLHWTDKADPARAAETVKLGCPHCGSLFEEKHKRAFNKGGVWLREGQTINADGVISGEYRKSKIASFHMNGTQAAFQTWESMAFKYISAKREMEESGDESALRATVLLDHGVPYKPKRNRTSRSASFLQDRAESWPKHSIPNGVRFLIQAVDVQINRFVVQVIGYGIGRQRWLIDRHEIQGIDPASYPEHWQKLTPLIDKKYDLADGTNRQMRVMITVCDSGGAEGVTGKAYDYWRHLQREPGGKQRRFLLVKGESKRNLAWSAQLRYPDTSGIKARGESRGDVPVLFVNTNKLKDELDADLRRNNPGHRFIHLPKWLHTSVYDEITNEEKDDKGGWVATGPNEGWDLLVYAEAAGSVLSPTLDEIDWSQPPEWADEWNKNILVNNPQPTSGQKPQARPQRRLTTRLTH